MSSPLTALQEGLVSNCPFVGGTFNTNETRKIAYSIKLPTFITSLLENTENLNSNTFALSIESNGSQLVTCLRVAYLFISSV